MRTSIKLKIILGIFATIVLLGLSISAMIYTHLSKELEEELINTAIFLAEHFSDMITDDVLTENYFSLKMASNDFKNSERDIEYIIIFNHNSKLVVHTFGDVFPKDLLDINKGLAGDKHNIETLIAEDRTIYDIAIPILKGDAGYIRMGVSATHIQDIVNHTIRDVNKTVGIVLAAGLAVAFVLGNRITRPIIELKQLAEAFGRGGLNRRAVIRTRDEIGHLAGSFNSMAERLDRTQSDLKQANTLLDSYSRDLEDEVKRQVADIRASKKLLEKKVEEQKEAERIIKDREYWLAESQRVAQIGTYDLDVLTGNWMSTEVLDDIFGIDDSYEKTVKGWVNIIHPENREIMEEYLQTILSEKIPFDKEYRIIRISDNQERWLHGKGELILSDDGNPTRMIGTIHDITERKVAQDRISDSLREKEVLLKEVHHRVKNNMMVISSLLNLQSGHANDEKYTEMTMRSQSRIRAMALVHEKLYMTQNFTKIDSIDYIHSLVDSIKGAYVGHLDTKETIDVDDIIIDIDALIPCGLIINELLTNSFKHAMNGQGPLKIGLSLKRHNDNRIVLTVKDNGPGLPEGYDLSRSEGIGFKLIKALVSQINGTYEIADESGLNFQITFPA
jgi:two-component sensor histidine kinase/HAMP domain-containing protein